MRNWKIPILTILAFAALACSTGCFAVMENDSELSLVWTTGLVWKQVGPADKDTQARLGIDIDEEFKKPLADHFLPTTNTDDEPAVDSGPASSEE